MWIDPEERRQVQLALQERLKRLDKRDRAAVARFENDFMGTGFGNNSNSEEASAA